jgi:hypothetical protein
MNGRRLGADIHIHQTTGEASGIVPRGVRWAGVGNMSYKKANECVVTLAQLR